MNQTKTLQELQDLVVEWSDKTLGSDVSIHSTLAHLVEEAEDLVKDPYNIMGYSDILLLLLNALKKSTYNTDDLLIATDAKLLVNSKRDWLIDADGIARHTEENE